MPLAIRRTSPSQSVGALQAQVSYGGKLAEDGPSIAFNPSTGGAIEAPRIPKGRARVPQTRQAGWRQPDLIDGELHRGRMPEATHRCATHETRQHARRGDVRMSATGSAFPWLIESAFSLTSRRSPSSTSRRPAWSMASRIASTTSSAGVITRDRSGTRAQTSSPTWRNRWFPGFGFATLSNACALMFPRHHPVAAPTNPAR